VATAAVDAATRESGALGCEPDRLARKHRPAPMKILFVMKHPGEVRLLGAVLGLLAERGHRIHLAFQGVKTGESRAALEELVAASPGISYGKLPSSGSSEWTYLARSLRLGIDYLRFISPEFEESTDLRASLEPKLPPTMHNFVRTVARSGPAGARGVRRTMQSLERSIEPPTNVVEYLAGQAPDMVVATQLVAVGSIQADFVRAAKRLGIRTAYTVLSWDNLTTKGIVRDVPDLVLVWNRGMATEARDLQDIPAGRIAVVGATAWDHWFDRRPRRTREEFCVEVGLSPDRPIVLYVGSSWWVIRDEPDFVRRWIEALRAHGGVLADAGVLVRPHPQRNSSEWGAATLDDPNVAVWPRFGEEPIGEEARQNYYDSIHHSAAVFGISTSAQIEAAIVDRPVHTVLSAEFFGRQIGTAHFQYLEDPATSPLVIAHDLGEHARLLERSLRGELPNRNRTFVELFARPRGLEVRATPLYVEAIEALGARPAPRPTAGPILGPLVRPVLSPLARRAKAEAQRRRGERPQTPTTELRRSIRRIARSEGPLVAGPWTDDEVGELLYWIPFLRWVTTANFGVAERMRVVVEPGTADWYVGLGVQLVEQAEPSGAETLPGDLIASLRADLAGQEPAGRIQHRLLDFAPLEGSTLPAGLATPYVAARIEYGPAFPDTGENRLLATTLLAHTAARTPVVLIGEGLEAPNVVALGGLDRATEVALISAAQAFVGTYGPSVLVAALQGTPSVALATVTEAIPTGDRRVVQAFLSRPPFALPRLVAPGELEVALDGLLAPSERVLAETF
jgi:hypothetical protein